jgi:hypothetical protein
VITGSVTAIPQRIEDAALDHLPIRLIGQMLQDQSQRLVAGPDSRQAPRGEIYAVDARTGRLVRTVPLYQSHLPPVATTVPLALDRRAGHIWALDAANETLCVLDTGTGHLLRRVALHAYGLYPQFYGLPPRFMVVDGVSHRGFALSVGPTGATLVAVLRI